MAGNPLAALKRRRRDLINEIKALKKEVDEIDDVVDRAEKLAQKIDSPSGFLSGGSAGGSGAAPQSSPGAKPAQVVSTVEEILSGSAMPMTRGQIMKALEERSVNIAGVNPANTLGTTLSRNKDIFVNIEGYGYWLKARDFAAGGYHANRGTESDQGEDGTEPIALH